MSFDDSIDTKTRDGGILDFFERNYKFLTIIIPIIATALIVIFWALPFFGIVQPTYQTPEESFEPVISIDFSNKDGTFSNKIIDLNHPQPDLTTSFMIKGLVPHEGTISIYIENYTFFGPANPNVFELKDASSNIKENFPVGKGPFEQDVFFRLYPMLRIKDSNYIVSLPSDVSCTATNIHLFYKIEYYDAIDKESTVIYLSQPFDGRWDVRGKYDCIPS